MHYLIFSIALLTAGHFFRTERWKLILRFYSADRTSDYLFSLSTGYVVSFFLPLRIGEIWRAYSLHRLTGKSFSVYLWSILAERSIDLLLLLTQIIIFSVWGEKKTSILLLFTLSTAIFSFFSLIITRNKLLFFWLEQCISIFNTSIQETLWESLWALFNCLEEVRKISFSQRFLLNTLSMWVAYDISIYFLYRFLSSIGFIHFEPFDLYSIVYNDGFFRSTFWTLTEIFSKLDLHSATIGLAIYFLAPAILISCYAILSRKSRNSIRLSNLLPVLNWHYKQQHSRKLRIFESSSAHNNFVKKYFNGNSIADPHLHLMNSNAIVLKDLSSGSAAHTWVIRDGQSEKIRKIAVGGATRALTAQVSWLKGFRNLLPVTEILEFEEDGELTYYDMPYDSSHLSFFEVIHTLPEAEALAILRSVTNQLSTNVHCKFTDADNSTVEKYIYSKVVQNAEKILAEVPSELNGFDSLKINGRSCKNLSFFLEKDFARIFALLISDKRQSKIHGDLTIENIIIDLNTSPDEPNWFLIDPNPENIFNSPLIDYSKLFQSLHSGYEFLTKISKIEISGNVITFPQFRSQRYELLLSALVDDLGGSDSDTVRDIYIHEIINFFRLVPYRMSKDKQLGLIYWATLLTLLNDFWERYRLAIEKAVLENGIQFSDFKSLG